MLVEIRTKGLPRTLDLTQYVERRLRFALGRFGPHIASVRVHLEDVNGPRGGVDKVCRVRVTGRQGWLLLVRDQDRRTTGAVDGAADRAGRAVARALDRRRRRGEGASSRPG